jgi:hypothetical protein
MPVIPPTQEVKIRRISLRLDLAKNYRDPHLNEQARHICNPSYMGGIGRRIVVQGQSGQKM